SVGGVPFGQPLSGCGEDFDMILNAGINGFVGGHGDAARGGGGHELTRAGAVVVQNDDVISRCDVEALTWSCDDSARIRMTAGKDRGLFVADQRWIGFAEAGKIVGKWVGLFACGEL